MTERDNARRILAQYSGRDRAPTKPSQTQLAYDELRTAILLGELAPDDILLEPALAVRFGVSKTPVREALRELVQAGYVTALPRKGYVVRALGLNDMREVYSLRALIQPPLAAAAAELRTEADLDDLESLIQRVPIPDTYSGGLLAGLEMQMIVVRAARNQRATQIVFALLFESIRFWMVAHPMPQVLETITKDQRAELITVATALRDRDSDAASRITSTAIAYARRQVAEQLMAGPLGD